MVCGKSESPATSQTSWLHGTWVPHRKMEAPKAWPGARHARDLQLEFQKAIPEQERKSRSSSHLVLPGVQEHMAACSPGLLYPSQEEMGRGYRKQSPPGWKKLGLFSKCRNLHHILMLPSFFTILAWKHTECKGTPITEIQFNSAGCHCGGRGLLSLYPQWFPPQP